MLGLLINVWCMSSRRRLRKFKMFKAVFLNDDIKKCTSARDSLLHKTAIVTVYKRAGWPQKFSLPELQLCRWNEYNFNDNVSILRYKFEQNLCQVPLSSMVINNEGILKDKVPTGNLFKKKFIVLTYSMYRRFRKLRQI